MAKSRIFYRSWGGIWREHWKVDAYYPGEEMLDLEIFSLGDEYSVLAYFDKYIFDSHVTGNNVDRHSEKIELKANTIAELTDRLDYWLRRVYWGSRSLLRPRITVEDLVTAKLLEHGCWNDHEFDQYSHSELFEDE